MISGAWLRLLTASAEGGRHWLRALRSAGTASRLLELSAGALKRAGLSSEEIDALRGAREPPAHWLAWLEAPEHRLVVYGSEHFPPRLAALEDAPLALWVTGADPRLLADPQIAIVGSRQPTANGRLIAASLAEHLSASGLTVTSGLARGIDAASHEGALRAGAGTIAVLGSGIDEIYPAANRGLAERIRQLGLVVSEYPPGTPVRGHRFPHRNRIIAGLTLGTLVVEAARRSGSLITARLAAEYGREVFAVPGSIHSPLSRGCHKLLREGAALVERGEDILVEIAPQLLASMQRDHCVSRGGSDDEMPAALARCLDFAPITFESLVTESGLTTGELSSMLLHLEIQGKIEALPGGRYCRLAKRG